MHGANSCYIICIEEEQSEDALDESQIKKGTTHPQYMVIHWGEAVDELDMSKF